MRVVLVIVIVVVHVHDLATGVEPAVRAHAVRAARLVALRALVDRGRGDLVLRAALRGARVRLLLLRDGHGRREKVADPSVELELGQLRPARVRRGLVRVVGILVEIRAALRAQAGAVRAARDLRRQRQRERVARPRREVELVVVVMYGEVSSSSPAPAGAPRGHRPRTSAPRGSRQRMHGPVERRPSKRSRSAQPLPVVRETSRRTGTSSGSTA